MAKHTQNVDQRVSAPNNFDSLRLIFAILVIFSHSFPLTRGSNDTEPLMRLTYGQISFGNVSVWAFFVISGFLITQSWQRTPKIIKFMKRRIGRIYPAFAVAGLMTALIVVPIAADPATFLPVSLQSYLLNTLRLQIFQFPSVFVHNPQPNILNGSLWSIAYEFWCYIGVMALGLAGFLRRRPVIVAVFFLAIGLHLYMDITGWAPSGSILGQIFGYPPFWAAVLPFYLAGTLFQLYGGRKLLRVPFLAIAVVLLIGSNFVPHGLVLTIPTCGAYLLMGLAYLPSLHPLNLGRFGDFSYGTYLYAMPIQQLLVLRAHGHISPWLLFAEAAPLTLLVGSLSWFFVERHFLQRSSQLKHEGILPVERQAISPIHPAVAEALNLEAPLSFAQPTKGIKYDTNTERTPQRNENPLPTVSQRGNLP
jgi:peptidoglycan/LPS O-acetylase OafA/YrhL